MTVTNVTFAKEVICHRLSKAEKAELMILLMVDDGYDANDVFTIVNDVLLFEQFPALVKKLGGCPVEDVKELCRCGHGESKHRMVRHADETFPVMQCATYKCICGMFEVLPTSGNPSKAKDSTETTKG